MKILVVEDNEINVEILLAFLEDEDAEVDVAYDGLQGWEYLQKNLDVDLILLDRMMPNMNGMELLAKIKGDARLKNIPVVMQSAAAMSDQVKEGIESGIYCYLSKPYSKEQLLEIISKVGGSVHQ